MLSLINVGDWLNQFKAFQRITFNYVPLNSIQVLEYGDSLHNIKPGSATADNKISLEQGGMGCKQWYYYFDGKNYNYSEREGRQAVVIMVQVNRVVYS